MPATPTTAFAFMLKEPCNEVRPGGQADALPSDDGIDAGGVTPIET
jgi:hypothetical protein